MQGWWAFLGWYENVFVWPLAIGALVLLLNARGVRQRVISACLLVLVFLPHIQKLLGDVYFDHLCRTQAGEFIYRTVDNVEGVLQMRPRDGSKDYFDRMRVGDIPEDPWGHTNVEAQAPWTLIGRYEFFETTGAASVLPSAHWDRSYHESMFALPTNGEPIARFTRRGSNGLRAYRKEFARLPRSKFGFTWFEKHEVLLGLLNIHKGVLEVLDLQSKDTLARKVGYLRVRPYDVCPSDKDDFMTGAFLERTLRPVLSHGGQDG